MKAEREITISGMTCGACVRHITNALAGVKGLDIKEISLGSARVAYDPADVGDKQILHAVRDAGYHAELKG